MTWPMKTIPYPTTERQRMIGVYNHHRNAMYIPLPFSECDWDPYKTEKSWTWTLITKILKGCMDQFADTFWWQKNGKTPPKFNSEFTHEKGLVKNRIRLSYWDPW